MNRFKNNLSVIDPKQPPDTVLERAVSLAQTNQAALTVVAVGILLGPLGIGVVVRSGEIELFARHIGAGCDELSCHIHMTPGHSQ